MGNNRKIAVIGATGAQGGAVVRALLQDGQFQVRALTRNTASDKAEALRQLGAEVAFANLDDVKSLEQAFNGCYGAFFLTNYWEIFDVDREMQQFKNLADAARTAGVKHVVNSTLEDSRGVLADAPTLQGKWKTPHLDGKGLMQQYVGTTVPTTHLLTSFYYENFIYFGMAPRPTADGQYVFALPLEDKRLPMVTVEDIGNVVAGIFKDPNLIGTTVGVASDVLSGEEIARSFSDVLGRSVSYYPIGFAEYAGLNFPGSDDLSNMFMFKVRNNEAFLKARDLQKARQISSSHNLKPFRVWLEENRAAFLNA